MLIDYGEIEEGEGMLVLAVIIIGLFCCVIQILGKLEDDFQKKKKSLGRSNYMTRFR